MSLITIAAVSLALGLGAGGAVWFGWEMVENVVAMLRPPKAPAVVKGPAPPNS